ncbi:DUF6286 domain-containing protein [uncultured Pseudokineococcus sp.]|uniref:DUF6286 domain-containing protein n=1 Tax=uncultured Pseudokineococcus sp. TaxID=1642928 RepID=UPI00261F5D8A|nr:DUF6286 domain-containing protein [uncultured Pseudokineococcus sp.]
MSGTTQQTRPQQPRQQSPQQQGGAGGGREPMRAAPERTGSGAVPVVGVLLALCLLALAVALVQHALVALGAIGGPAWPQVLVEGVRGTAPATWMVPVGVVLALVGLWLVLRVALGRRTRSEVRLRSRTAVSVEPRDLARLASSAARDVDGVLGARSSADRRKVVVRVQTTGEASVPGAVQQAVAERLRAVERQPSVRVRVEGGDR